MSGARPAILQFTPEIHGFLLRRTWISAFTTSVDFFDRKLRNRPIAQ